MSKVGAAEVIGALDQLAHVDSRDGSILEVVAQDGFAGFRVRGRRAASGRAFPVVAAQDRRPTVRSSLQDEAPSLLSRTSSSSVSSW
jgi:hypothetical protein